MRRWELFAHDADVGVRGYGRDMAEAFEQAALAMTAAITDPAGVAQKVAVDIACEAPDAEILLADWLNALVYEMAARGLLFSRFEVSTDGKRLQARAHGEALDPARHQPAAEVKGATFTSLRVERAPSGEWMAQCVVDV